MYHIQKGDTRHVKPLHLQATNFEIKFTGALAQSGISQEETLDAVLKEIFDTVSDGYSAGDRWGVDFWFPGMTKICKVGIRPVEDFSPSLLRRELYNHLQSQNEEARIDDKVITLLEVYLLFFRGQS